MVIFDKNIWLWVGKGPPQKDELEWSRVVAKKPLMAYHQKKDVSRARDPNWELRPKHPIEAFVRFLADRPAIAKEALYLYGCRALADTSAVFDLLPGHIAAPALRRLPMMRSSGRGLPRLLVGDGVTVDRLVP